MIESKYWYTEVNQLARHWAKKTGYSINQVVAIIAVLSPMINWSTNLKWAYEVLTLDNPKNYMFEANLNKALRIKDGEKISKVLSGMKVRSFYTNILRPKGKGTITIDRHMLRLIHWPNETVTKKQYQSIQARYSKQAHYHGLIPSQYQAILWCATRGKGKEYVS